MTRILFTIVLPLAAPFLAWWLYLLFARRRARHAGEPDPPGWTKAPWLLIGLTGIVLMAATLLLFRATGGGEAWRDYEAPRLEDGRIVPGGVRERQGE